MLDRITDHSKPNGARCFFVDLIPVLQIGQRVDVFHKPARYSTPECITQAAKMGVLVIGRDAALRCPRIKMRGKLMAAGRASRIKLTAGLAD